MILVDTSVWIDHLHRAEAKLLALLDDAQICTHPAIIEELALGSLRRRREVLDSLASLPWAPVATHDEVLVLVDTHELYGVGLSMADAHLLAAARLGGHQLWSRDRRLRTAANRLGVGPVVS